MTDERKEGQPMSSIYYTHCPRCGQRLFAGDEHECPSSVPVARCAAETQSSNSFTVNADGTSPYHINLAQPEPRGSEALTEEQVRDACESAGYPNFPGWCFVLTAKLNAALAAATAERTPDA